MPLKLSYCLPHASAGNAATQLDLVVDAAVLAERHGVHAVSVTDHPFPLPHPGRPGHQAFDPFVELTLVGGATRTVRLHFSLIVLPYRNPFVVARALSTMDAATRGRVIAGIGAGYLRGEFDALGAGYDDRNRQVDEGVAAMRAAWRGRPVHARSAHWQADGNEMQPPPHTPGGPVLWRGGHLDRVRGPRS